MNTLLEYGGGVVVWVGFANIPIMLLVVHFQWNTWAEYKLSVLHRGELSYYGKYGIKVQGLYTILVIPHST